MSISKLTAYFLVRRMLKDGSLELGPVERNVLLQLAGWADPDGSHIVQSYDSIAEVTGYSRSAVRDAVANWLSVKILILIEPGGGRGHAPEYAIDLGKVDVLTNKGASPQHLPKGAAEEHLSGAKVPPQSTKGAIKVQKGAVERHPPSSPSLPAKATGKEKNNPLAALAACPSSTGEQLVPPVSPYLTARSSRVIDEFGEEVYLVLLKFEAHRKKIRKPLTEYGLELLLKKLGELRAKGNDPVKVLERSIMQGWSGIFPLEKERTDGHPKSFHERRSEQSAQAIEEVLGRFEKASCNMQRALPPTRK